MAQKNLTPQELEWSLAVKKRMNEIIYEVLKIETATEVALKSGIKVNTFTKSLDTDGKEPIDFSKADFYIRIKNAYPQINLNYILAGELPKIFSESDDSQGVNEESIGYERLSYDKEKWYQAQISHLNKTQSDLFQALTNFIKSK